MAKVAGWTYTGKIMPIVTGPSPTIPDSPLVVLLAYDQLGLFEFGIATEIFGLPRPEVGPNWYRFAIVAAEPPPLRLIGGLTLQVDGGLDLLAEAHTIIVPSWRRPDAAAPGRLLEALRAAHARGARLVSICLGAFVLAQAGLLNGRRATTHWRHAAALAKVFPGVTVKPDVLYVDEDDVLTSAGSAAGIDLCLHIVRRDYGPTIANQVARRLVMPVHRDGGQAQFIERPVAAVRERSRLAPLLERIAGNPRADLSIAGLAADAGLTVRTFLRRFRAATGTTPGEWLAKARVERARDMLESTAASVEDIATACGFGSVEALRHQFRKRVRLSPAQYRKRFGRQAGDEEPVRPDAFSGDIRAASNARPGAS